MAGIFALKDAFKKAGPILLEPIMKVEVTTPSDYQGEIVGDISRRRGTIEAIDSKNNQVVVECPRCRWPRNVRLCDGDPVAVEGPRILFHGTGNLRTGAQQRVDHDFGFGQKQAGGTDGKPDVTSLNRYIIITLDRQAVAEI